MENNIALKKQLNLQKKLEKGGINDLNFIYLNSSKLVHF